MYDAMDFQKKLFFSETKTFNVISKGVLFFIAKATLNLGTVCFFIIQQKPPA